MEVRSPPISTAVRRTLSRIVPVRSGASLRSVSSSRTRASLHVGGDDGVAARHGLVEEGAVGLRDAAPGQALPRDLPVGVARIGGKDVRAVDLKTEDEGLRDAPGAVAVVEDGGDDGHGGFFLPGGVSQATGSRPTSARWRRSATVSVTVPASRRARMRSSLTRTRRRSTNSASSSTGSTEVPSASWRGRGMPSPGSKVRLIGVRATSTRVRAGDFGDGLHDRVGAQRHAHAAALPLALEDARHGLLAQTMLRSHALTRISWPWPVRGIPRFRRFRLNASRSSRLRKFSFGRATKGARESRGVVV